MKLMPFTQVRRFENAHISLWLLKDLCWAMGYHLGGLIMIVPTALVALLLTWQARKNTNELVHNIAVCMWIAANSTWMVGEFYFKDAIKPMAIVFFGIGLAVLSIYYLVIVFKMKE
jgi:F0F1-type ATP synthase assembly protein I